MQFARLAYHTVVCVSLSMKVVSLPLIIFNSFIFTIFGFVVLSLFRKLSEWSSELPRLSFFNNLNFRPVISNGSIFTFLFFFFFCLLLYVFTYCHSLADSIYVSHIGVIFFLLTFVLYKLLNHRPLKSFNTICNLTFGCFEFLVFSSYL